MSETPGSLVERGDLPPKIWTIWELRNRPKVRSSSVLIWLFELAWRPLFLIAVIWAGLWYRQSYKAKARHG